jgi:hypothetical protein
VVVPEVVLEEVDPTELDVELVVVASIQLKIIHKFTLPQGDLVVWPVVVPEVKELDVESEVLVEVLEVDPIDELVEVLEVESELELEELEVDPEVLEVDAEVLVEVLEVDPEVELEVVPIVLEVDPIVLVEEPEVEPMDELVEVVLVIGHSFCLEVHVLLAH